MIRPFRASDEPILRAIHEAQGFDYEFPDLSQFECVMVSTDEQDSPIQAMAARKTIEAFFLGDPNYRTPRWRMAHFAPLHDEMSKVLRARGFTDVHAWLPPQIAKQFGNRLRRTFGWIPSVWQTYVKYL